MDRGRGLRGWLAAITVGVTLSLLLLSVERYSREQGKSYLQILQSVTLRGASTAAPGILLTADPGLAGARQFPRTDRTPISRSNGAETQSAADFMRRPPEPAPTVALYSPIAVEELVQLPLHSNDSDLASLMNTMDEALQRPVKQVSMQRESSSVDDKESLSRLASLPSPTSLTGRIPRPIRLIEDIENLRQLARSGSVPVNSDFAPYYVGTQRANRIDRSECQQILSWTAQVEPLLESVVMNHGLERAESRTEIANLAGLAAQASILGESMTNHLVAAQVIRTGYALQRRVIVWQAIQRCLDGTSIALDRSRNPGIAREQLREVLDVIEQKIAATGAAESWREYLLLDRLTEWVDSPQDIWSDGNSLALSTLSRLKWARLSPTQQEFLAQEEFLTLARLLSTWSRDPVDYRQLLQDLEQYETDSLSRSAESLTGAVQVLRNAETESQRLVASTLNDHYRNANLRVSISREMIQRFLPSSEIEVRPIRRRIMGADTRGDSTVQTKLNVQFIPDPTGWNIDIGVEGDLVSNTRSSKGPATFHNTSQAFVTTHRYVRLDPQGYQVTSEPTGVASQEYLRKMSTDFDGLPVIGDFVRLIVREQFDQKRGIAKRISQRIIAQETDAELDRRLAEGLQTAQQRLTKQILGPLVKLQLNPLVVSMKSTEQRLGIRYRVANENQMAAHTARPRAPSDSLASLQFHQTVINNTIASIGLSGRKWTIQGLYARLGEVFQQAPWEVPDDVPEDVTIRFAARNPATVEFLDGKLRLTLRILELQRGNGRPIKRCTVTTRYIPVAEGLNAELIRDGAVWVDALRDNLVARFIFTKVFVAQPQIPLISQAWVEDPRSEDLAVSQVELRDGWLSVAISPKDSQMAAEVAERSRLIKSDVIR